MLTFIHTDINISSTTKSGATIGMGKFTGIYKSFIQDHQLLAGKVAVDSTVWSPLTTFSLPTHLPPQSQSTTVIVTQYCV